MLVAAAAPMFGLAARLGRADASVADARDAEHACLGLEALSTGGTMQLRPKSALGRLVNGLRREPHDYRPSLEVFPVLNVDKRGPRNGPATESGSFDDVENRIVERIEAENNAAHGTLLDEIRTYKER